jgi:hypothetical protein
MLVDSTRPLPALLQANQPTDQSTDMLLQTSSTHAPANLATTKNNGLATMHWAARHKITTVKAATHTSFTGVQRHQG